MIEPTLKDIRRRVIYKPDPDSTERMEAGVISSFNDDWVFVRYDDDGHPKATARVNLYWQIPSEA